ncbi:MAG: tyrosine-type recombinase/integrase [Trueperaceae bacterium]|nr:MAG: tyrosine-type recombinase/integrase [Trueperaceae bacterium]
MATTTPQGPESIMRALELLDGETGGLTLRRLRQIPGGLGAAQTLFDLFGADLRPNQREVLERTLGLHTGLSERLADLACELGVSRERAGAIFRQGLANLMKAARESIDLQPENPEAPGTGLVRYRGDAAERASYWAELPDGERRRLAAQAAQLRDHEVLWELTLAHLILYGDKGTRVSERTVETYRHGVADLLADWQGENLLRPAATAGVNWVRALERRVLRDPRDGSPLLEPGSGRLRYYAPATVALKLAAAKALYRALRWAGATQATPFVDVKPTRDPVHPWDKREAYRAEELELLITAAEPADRVVVLLGAHAGLRLSEMAALRWADVDVAGRRLTVVLGKGGKTAAVALSRRLCESLAALPRGHSEDFVLPFRAARARERFKQLCRRNGVRYRGREVHGLRHSAGVRVYQQFGSFDRVAEHLRQADVNTGKRYGYLADEALSEGLKDW